MVELSSPFQVFTRKLSFRYLSADHITELHVQSLNKYFSIIWSITDKLFLFNRKYVLPSIWNQRHIHKKKHVLTGARNWFIVLSLFTFYLLLSLSQGCYISVTTPNSPSTHLRIFLTYLRLLCSISMRQNVVINWKNARPISFLSLSAQTSTHDYNISVFLLLCWRWPLALRYTNRPLTK